MLVYQSPLPAESRDALRRNLGMNVAAPLDWEADIMMNDAMVSARSWEGLNGQPLAAGDLDENWWPKTDARIVVWHGQRNAEPGIYTLKFLGKAQVTVAWTPSDVLDDSYDSARGESTFRFRLTAAVPSQLQLEFRNTGSGVRHVRLYRPGKGRERTEGFYQVFLDSLKDVGTLRFMDFTGTNSSTESRWSERVRPEYSSHYRNLVTDADGDGLQDFGWQGRGFSWEQAVALANTARKDLWICVPILADDDYVRNLALVLRDGRTDSLGRRWQPLSPDLKLVVELSNEVWNTQFAFQQYLYNNRAAVQEALGDSLAAEEYNYDGARNLQAAAADPRSAEAWMYGRMRTIKRLLEISTIFREVFGDAQMITRIRPYLGWQIGNANNVAGTMFAFWDNVLAKKYTGGLSRHIWGGGATAYYSPESSGGLTLDTLWQSGDMDARGQWRRTLDQDARFCALYGLTYSAYEGGPGFGDTLGSNTESSAKSVLQAAWKDERIVAEMLEHQEVWDQAGGGLLCYFTYGGDYQFGFTEDPRVTTPKLRALSRIASQAPLAADLGRPLPAGRVLGRQFEAADPGWMTPPTWTDAGYVDLNSGQPSGWLAYFFRDDAPRGIRLQYQYRIPTGGVVLKVLWNGEEVDVRTTTGGSGVQTVTLPDLKSRRGSNTLRLTFAAPPGTSVRCEIPEFRID